MGEVSTAEAGIPGPPDPHGVNVRPQTYDLDPSFDNLYGGRYAGALHYEDAKKAFHSRALTPLWETGVNTWHEQILAGRISLAAVRAVGMSRLGKASRDKGKRYELLHAMSGAGGGVEPKLVRVALDMLDRAQQEYGHADKRMLHHALFLAGELGEAAGSIPCWVDVYDSAGTQLERELGPYPAPPDRRESAMKLATYVGEYWRELYALTGYHGRPSAEEAVQYRGFAFVRLMRAGIDPHEAANASLRSMTVDRAIEAHGLPSAVADGAL